MSIESRAADLRAPSREHHSPWVGSFLKEFLASLRRKAIAHCLLRNYESYPFPRSRTSDIDLLVDADRWTDVQTVLQQTAAAANLRVLLSYTNATGTLLLVFLAGEDGPALHLDLFTGLSWQGHELLNQRRVLAEALVDEEPPRPRPGHEAAFSMLAHLFHRGVVKQEYRSRIARLVGADRSAFASLISEVWGAAQAERLVELVVTERWDSIPEWRTTAIVQLRRQAWCLHPLRTLGRTLDRLRNGLYRLIRPPGLWLALVGPDGCGKTTINAALGAALADIFAPDKAQHLHWRPELLPAPRSLLVRAGSCSASTAPLTPLDDPHALAPYSLPISLLRFLYFAADFLLGANLLFRPRLWRSGLLVVDRYFYDFQIDQRRYRLRVPLWIVALTAKCIPEPDLVFYLDAPVDVILRRKAEVTPEELSRQRLAFRAMVAAMGSRGRVVDADRPVHDVVADLREQVLVHLAAREDRRSAARAPHAV